MRTDANKIALRAIRALLGGGKPFEIDVGATRISCSMTAVPAEPWPAGIGGLVEGDDGPWPGAVAIECRWADGSCRLVVEIDRWRSGVYLHDLCVRVRTEKREVIFVNVSNELEDALDGRPVKLGVRFYVTKRKTHVSQEIADALNAGMRDALAESEIPILGKNTAELCEVEVPEGTLLPSAELVFRRLIHLALLKIDFIDRRRTVERGKPIVDLDRWLTTDQIRAVRDDDVEDAEIEANATGERQYWAGGFGEPTRLEKFVAENSWQIGWKRTSDKPAAKKAWKMFAGVKPGDYFAIKGLGGKYDLADDLTVHYIGEVVSVDQEEGRLALQPLTLPHFNGKGPTGPGAGNWQATLLPITRPDVIGMIFGPNAGEAAGVAARVETEQTTDGLPLNLILYGPPGTGKTHHLTHSFIGKFQRAPTKADADTEIAEELTWVQVTAIALHDSAGRRRSPHSSSIR
jgi:hypothetical protein